MKKVINPKEYKVEHKYSQGGIPAVERKIVPCAEICDNEGNVIEVDSFAILPDNLAIKLAKKYPWLIVKDISEKEVKKIRKEAKSVKIKSLKESKEARIEQLKAEIEVLSRVPKKKNVKKTTKKAKK